MAINVKKIASLSGHNASIYALTGGKEANWFYSGAGDGWVVQWDLKHPENGRLVAKVETNVFSLLYLQDKNQILAGNMNGGLHWIDLNDSSLTQNILHHKKGIFKIFRANEFVYTCGGDGILTKWNIAEKRTKESLQLSAKALRCGVFNKKRQEIAVGASDNSIFILEANTLELKKVIKNAHQNSVFALTYSPDNRYLLSGGRDAMLKIWDLESDFELISAQAGHLYTINDICFSPNGELFSTASRDKTIKIWNTKDFTLLKVINVIKFGGHINSVNQLLWSSYNNWLISCSDDRIINIWEVEQKNT